MPKAPAPVAKKAKLSTDQRSFTVNSLLNSVIQALPSIKTFENLDSLVTSVGGSGVGHIKLLN